MNNSKTVLAQINFKLIITVTAKKKLFVIKTNNDYFNKRN